MESYVRTTNGQLLYISTKPVLFGNGEYETMVFPCNENKQVTDWGGIDEYRYSDSTSAKFGHEVVCKKWRKRAYV